MLAMVFPWLRRFLFIFNLLSVVVVVLSQKMYFVKFSFVCTYEDNLVFVVYSITIG